MRLKEFYKINRYFEYYNDKTFRRRRVNYYNH